MYWLFQWRRSPPPLLQQRLPVAIDNTRTKVAKIIAAANNGTDNEELVEMVCHARQWQKDIANNELDLTHNQPFTLKDTAKTYSLRICNRS